jgi:hypothetical protein
VEGKMIRLLPIALMVCIIFTVTALAGCSALRSEHAIIYQSDLPAIRQAQSIHEVQDRVMLQTHDMGRALLFSSLAGIGLGFYESRIFYGGRAFPGQTGPEWDWFRQDRSGDAWLKIGSSDKLARWLYTSSLHNARMSWSRYFGGYFILSWLADFIVMNTVATIIRSYGKHGELRLNLDISLPEF